VDDKEIQQLDDLESSHFWYKARKLQLSRWFYGKHVGLQVLDLGSATGGNTLHVSLMGHNVTSLEYSEIGVQIQRGKGIPVIQADARELPFSESSFDIVICLDVLEHITEDYLVASEIRRVLKPGGRFLISVPEDPKLWSEHDVAVNHVRRYSKAMLLDLVSNSGLKSQHIWSTLVFLRPAVMMYRRRSKGSSLEKVNSILNSLLFLICKAEVSLPKTRVKGVTLWIDGNK
jgi:SAM-dependent methyltransferase